MCGRLLWAGKFCGDTLEPVLASSVWGNFAPTPRGRSWRRIDAEAKLNRGESSLHVITLVQIIRYGFNERESEKIQRMERSRGEQMKRLF